MKLVVMAVWLVVAGSTLSAGPVYSYYQFSGNLNDSGSAGVNRSILTGTDSYTNPGPTVPYPNVASLNLFPSTAVQFNSGFALDTPGDWTLEFYLNPGTTNPADIFWTTISNQDSNRFNIFLDGDGLGGDRLNLDYRDSSGTLHPLLNSEQPGGVAANFSIPINVWTFVAIVRSGTTYAVYFNGNASPTASATDGTGGNPTENLPTSTGWTINGREQQKRVLSVLRTVGRAANHE
jgi:hypothetical protein